MPSTPSPIRALRLVRSIAWCGLFAVAAAPRAAGQFSSASTPRLETLGPQVGARIPPFALRDQNGRVQTLATVIGAKGAMVVFFRSADW